MQIVREERERLRSLLGIGSDFQVKVQTIGLTDPGLDNLEVIRRWCNHVSIAAQAILGSPCFRVRWRGQCVEGWISTATTSDPRIKIGVSTTTTG